MERVSSMKSSDFEHLETRDNPLQPGGRALAVRVSKTGGGTLDRAYEGTWIYRVTYVGSQHVLMEGDDLRIGTPKTHRQIAEIIMDFLPEELGGRS